MPARATAPTSFAVTPPPAHAWMMLFALGGILPLRPKFKTNGIFLPGYHAGHWLLREKLGKAFCLLTDRRRVLWLPARDGTSQLLLSLERPRTLLDALRAVRG